MGPPRVSVICIFLDAKPYLREAIDSVLGQEFRDFELLLVDDGSSDGSTEIALQMAARLPGQVRYLEHAGHANQGMSATRNLGLREAQGELIGFIDADDRWRPVKLQEQVDLLDSLPEADAIAGSVNYWSSHAGGKDRIVQTGLVRKQLIGPVEATLAFYPLGKADAPSMSDMLFRRSAIDAVGGFEDRFRGAYEDQAFLAKFYLSSTLFVADNVWSDYRLHSNSCMAKLSQAGGYYEARRTFLEWLERYVAGRSNADARIGAAIARALRPYRSKGLIDQARSILRETPVGAIVRSGKAAARRLRPIVAPGPAILMYHRIADESFDPWGMAVSPQNFADQLDWLKRHRTALPMSEFIDLKRHRKLPRDAVAVTFDDGYACNAQVAMPLLERLGIPATIFLSTELIERGEEFWWDELERIVIQSPSTSIDLNGITIVLGARQPRDEVWLPAAVSQTPRQQAYHQLWTMLYELPAEETAEALELLRGQSGLPAKRRDTHRPLTRDEIRAAAQSDVIDFGSHALTHPSLPKLDTEERVRQIRGSISACTDLTGRRPRAFAYPYGDFDPHSRQLVEEAGYDCACKADGWFVRAKTDLFALPRIFVGNWGSARLARELGRP